MIQSVMPKNKIAVTRADAPKESKGGILLPENATSETPNKGIVELVGGSVRENTGLDIMPGHTVFFSKYVGSQIKDEDTKLLIIESDDILMVQYEEK